MRDKRMKRKVAVVGGGASGMMAAISAAGEGAEVTLFEKNDRVGKKILATGNGKCNFSNKVMSADCFYGTGSVQVEKYLQRFGTADTIHFFEQLGMRVKDRNGYLYPASEQASTVLDVLCMELARRKITVKTQSGVKSIRKENEKLEIRTAAKESSLWDAVILTCGGLASPKTGSNGDGLYMARALGHDIVTPVPALTALRCEGDFWKSITGVRCEAKIDLVVDGETVLGESGELQFTDYGISGIPVFQISREAAYALEARKKSLRADPSDPGFRCGFAVLEGALGALATGDDGRIYDGASEPEAESYASAKDRDPGGGGKERRPGRKAA